MEINAVKRASLAIFGKKVRIQILRLEAWVPGTNFRSHEARSIANACVTVVLCGKMPERCVVYG